MTGCQHCGHHHPDRTCSVVRVSGPAVDNPGNTAHLHEGREVTPCCCEVYTPTVNGATL